MKKLVLLSLIFISFSAYSKPQMLTLSKGFIVGCMNESDAAPAYLETLFLGAKGGDVNGLHWYNPKALKCLRLKSSSTKKIKLKVLKVKKVPVSQFNKKVNMIHARIYKVGDDDVTKHKLKLYFIDPMGFILK